MVSQQAGAGPVVVKYFFEEPAALEVLSDPEEARQAEQSLERFLAARRFYRGYLAATDLGTGRTGVTAVDPTYWLGAFSTVVESQPSAGTAVCRLRDGTVDGGRAAEGSAAGGEAAAGSAAEGSLDRFLTGAKASDVLYSGPTSALRSVREGPSPSRPSDPGFRGLLEAGVTILIAEPAPDGVDWSVYSEQPVADRLRDEFAKTHDHPQASARLPKSAEPPGVLHFVIPIGRARGEHRFYFERYDLDLFKDCLV